MRVKVQKIIPRAKELEEGGTVVARGYIFRRRAASGHPP